MFVHDSKKEEKDKKRKKRIADMLFYLNVSRANANNDISAPSEERKTERAPKTHKNEDYTKKLATVQKSLELRKREAKDRWNRFAGTSGAGGMGR